jgi:hypothetical protein
MKKFIIHVFSPLLLGLIIYFLFRKTSGLVVSQYFGWVWANKVVFSAPNFIRYNLPDGLWLYSFTSAQQTIWGEEITLKNLIWVLLVPIIAFLSELLQSLGLVRGTFDFLDLVIYAIATIAAFSHFKFNIFTFK